MGSTGARKGKQNKSKSESKSYKKHFSNLKVLGRKKYSDGTYNTQSLSKVNLKSGFQASYWQMGDNYSQEDHDRIISETMKLLKDKTIYAGKYDGAPEISFRFDTKEDAMRYARKYNQISIYDNAKGNVILNKKYRKGEGNG